MLIIGGEARTPEQEGNISMWFNFYISSVNEQKIKSIN